MSSPHRYHQRPQGNPLLSAAGGICRPRPTSKAWPNTKRLWTRAKDDPEGFWAEQAEVAALVQDVGQGARLERTARAMVRRRQDQRQLQLPRPPSRTPAAATRPPSSGKASRAIRRVLTYQDLHREVCKFANVLKGSGHQAGRPRHHLYADDSRSGDRHAGLRRIGGDAFASSSAASAPTPSPIATTTPRRSWSSPPTAAGGAARSCRSSRTSTRPWTKSPTVEKCIVFNRCNQPVDMKPGRDLWWHELMADASADCPAEPLDSEHPLFILYTSGSTGKPKGVLHTTAGYLLGVAD